MTPGTTEAEAIVERINDGDVNVLFVGMGMGRQEQWILDFMAAVSVDLIMPCGACFDYIAEAIPTPPRWLGPIGLVGGVAGTLIGGFATDRLSLRDKRWYVWFPSAAILTGLPAFAWVCLTEQFAVAIGLLIFPNLFGAIHNGPSFAMVQSLSPVHMRAMASAIALLVTNLIGLGLGPLVIGGLSQALEPTFGDRSLAYAMLVVIPLNCWAAAHYYLAGRTLRADLKSPQ